MSDFKSLFEAKSREFEELTEQFSEYEQQSNLIINDLEQELKEVKRKNDQLTREISDQKVTHPQSRKNQSASKAPLNAKSNWRSVNATNSRKNLCSSRKKWSSYRSWTKTWSQR